MKYETTPAPWQYKRVKNDIVIYGCGGLVPEVVLIIPKADEVDEANAEMIVKAVNKVGAVAMTPRCDENRVLH